jgi:hypothetical protein
MEEHGGMYYKIIMETGHMGAGKSLDRVRYCQGRDILSMLHRAHGFPRVKRKERRRGVVLIQQISKLEYEKGRHAADHSRH